MRNFFHNCKGAVTVMVTLLLIPSILVSGTGVDLARIYTAKSIVEDANQLAANSVLASYEALLQDLYGLFGVMTGGEINPEQYVKWAIEGGDWEKGIGTFQVFYGSTVNPAVLTPEPTQYLGNAPVLRRQIEEYSKLRAPAIIAELLIEKLDVFQKVQEDAKVIKKKMEVDDGVEELEKYYKKIYDHVNEIDPVGSREDEMTSDYEATAKRIQDILKEMQGFKEVYRVSLNTYNSAKEIYENTEDAEEREAAKATMDEMEARMLEIRIYYQDRWGKVQDASQALWTRYRTYERELNQARDKLEQFLTDCIRAENKKKDLKKKIDELRSALNSGKCSDTLNKGLTEPNAGDPDGLSILERYEALLKYNIGNMGQSLRDHNTYQIQKTIEILLKAKLGPFELLSLRTMDCDSYFPLDPDYSDSFSEVVNVPTEYKSYGKGTNEGYKLFEQIKPPESKEFWDELEQLYSTSKDGASKNNLNKAISTVLKKAQDVFKGLLNFEPAGADKLIGASDESVEGTGSKFGTGDEWSSKDKGKNELKKSLDGDFLGKLANTANEAGNKLLILVYDTEMFSDFSCPKQGQEGYPKENMAGIPLSTEVNYYFQSELEYLYNGNLADAVDNLKSVAGMMFLVRFIMDYIASFTILEVNDIVNSVKGAMSWSGPFAVLAGELARLALSIGEAALDVSRLREGAQVALFKTASTWTLSISGMKDIAKEGLNNAAVESAFQLDESKKGDDPARDGDEGITLGYTDYMRLFLLLVPGDTLANRTRNLIELNVTNYKYKVNAEEEEMPKHERYDLGKVFTGFTMTTTVDLRMLFLSMPFAQEGINGVVPPKTLPITVTDYRGY